MLHMLALYWYQMGHSFPVERPGIYWFLLSVDLEQVRIWDIEWEARDTKLSRTLSVLLPAVEDLNWNTIYSNYHSQSVFPAGHSNVSSQMF